MKTVKEYRSEYAGLVAKAEAWQTEWNGKEAESGYPKALEELRATLGKADETRAMLDTALALEGHQESVRDGQAPVAVRAAQFREALPNEGATERVLDAASKPAYKHAFEAYMRRDIDGVGPNDRKTLSEAIDEAGGFTVPTEMTSKMVKKQMALPSIRANATILTTIRDAVAVPMIRYAGAGAKLYTSGVRMKWVGELPASSSEHRVTDPTFGSEQVQVHTAMASMPLTNDLLEDSNFNLEEYVPDILGEAFYLGEEETFWSGTGAGQPQGLLTHPMASTADSTTADGMMIVTGDASLLTADGLINLAMALPEQYDINAKWFFNKRSSESAIRKLKSATSGDYLWPVIPMVGNLGPASLDLLGYPVVRSPWAPDVAGNAYPIVFGDMRGYRIVDRVGLSIQRLREVYAETNLTVFLARKRLGGKLIEPYRLKTQKVST